MSTRDEGNCSCGRTGTKYTQQSESLFRKEKEAVAVVVVGGV